MISIGDVYLNLKKATQDLDDKLNNNKKNNTSSITNERLDVIENKIDKIIEYLQNVSILSSSDGMLTSGNNYENTFIPSIEVSDDNSNNKVIKETSISNIDDQISQLEITLKGAD